MLVDTILKLGEEKDRKAIAKQVSRMLGIEDLIIFIKDPEIQKLLPAPGFQQTLPIGKQLQEIVNRSLIEPYTTYIKINGNSFPVNGYPITKESVVLLIGGIPDKLKFDQLKKVLPLLVRLFLNEQKLLANEGLVQVVESEASKSRRLANVLDQTRQKLQNALIQQKKDQRSIENLLKRKDEFINIASHELKTPLTSMKGYMELMFELKNSCTDNVQNYIVKANKQVEKLIGLINDLLDVNKFQSGHVDLNFEDLDLNEIISDSVEELQTTTSTHHIQWEKAPEEIIVHVDRMRLEQVISNIVSNAIKYSPEANKIHVSLEKHAQEAKVLIEDHGIGISPKEARLIFNRFYRANKDSNQFYGLGLGLYISSSIIIQHEGQIGVENGSHGGSLFWFTLPTVEEC
jgi:K+-sensing histidine kinase KdpD